MSRPLTGRLVSNPSGTFTAEIPIARGSSKRRSVSFTTKAAAERWRDAGILALQSGHQIPEPDVKHLSSMRLTSSSGSTSTRFRTVGEDWIQERYIEDGHGEIGREAQVRRFVNVIDSYMSAKSLTVETITRQDLRTMYKRLLKDTSTPAHVDFPVDEDPQALVTKQEGLALLERHARGVSRSSFTRAVRTGALGHVGTRGAAHLYAVGDLFNPAAGLTPRWRGDAGRYGHTTLGDVRRTFRAVLEHAKSEGIRIQPGVRAVKLPKNKQRKRSTQALTLVEMARVAARLHVVHQFALALLRTLGLRISEAYGLLVEDVIDYGPGRPGLVTVQSQGGRSFKRRTADGGITAADHVDETKRDSWRVLVAPAPVMDLIRVVIDVFHTNPEGRVDLKARLIPGLVTVNVGGQSSFRAALAAAAAAEDLNIVVDRGRAAAPDGDRSRTLTPQHLRKSFATALEATTEKIEHIRAALGHSRGEEVIHRHYLVHDPELRPQRAVAEATTIQITEAFPQGLMVITTKRCTTHNQPALAYRAAEIDAKLFEIGWLTQPRPPGDWLTVSDAAATRGVTCAQIRDDIRDGRLPAIVVRRDDQEGTQYLVAAADVLAMADRLGTGSELRQLAEELHVAYDTVRHFVVRHPEITCQSNGGRDYRVTEDVADTVRAYFQAQRSLFERARRMPEVADELGISVAGVDTHIRHGRLVEDDRFHGGVRSITKASLDGLQHRGRRGRPPKARSTGTAAAASAGNELRDCNHDNVRAAGTQGEEPPAAPGQLVGQ